MIQNQSGPDTSRDRNFKGERERENEKTLSTENMRRKYTCCKNIINIQQKKIMENHNRDKTDYLCIVNYLHF